MELFFSDNINDNLIILDKIESNHCMRVLRHTIGDIIKIIDGKGNLYEGIIKEFKNQECNIEIQKTIHEDKREYYIHIAISSLKNHDRIEWFVEKAIEIGVDEISFIECRRTERTHIRLNRLRKISISAIKQSLRTKIPKINEILNFNEFILNLNSDNSFICHCKDEPKKELFQFKNKILDSFSTCILIGPEGGFNNDEIKLALKNNISPITLGSSRLRTETAGIVACHLLNLMNSLNHE